MAATTTVKAGQNPLVFTGELALTLSTQSWYTSDNVTKVFIPTANNQGFQSGAPGNGFGVTQLPAAPANRRTGLVLVAKRDFQVPTALFGPVPKPSISTIGSATRAPGELLFIGGTDFDTLAYVLVGGVSALVDAASLTSTGVSVTVPFLPAATNVPVVVITTGGISNTVSALSITATNQSKLGTPVLTPASVTDTSVYYTWPAVPGANNYVLTVNGGTMYPLGNVGSYILTNLSPGATVSSTLVAKDSTGNRTDSDPSVAAAATTTGGSAPTSGYSSAYSPSYQHS